MYYAGKRQEFLINQGYFFQVLEKLPYIDYAKEDLEKMFELAK
jgi:hypothetical protein